MVRIICYSTSIRRSPATYQRFDMPIDIVVDGTTYVVFNDADPEHFVIPIDAPASSVELDPDAWILWSNRSSISYVAGPPKIVETSPAPGDELSAAASTDTVTVTFHTNVNTSAAHYSLVGDSVGSVSVTYGYDSGSNTVTLTAGADLAPDAYTLTVSDALTAVNSGDQLDGEIADPLDPASLPSGEGLEGGSAVIQFVVAGSGSSLADLNCDGSVNSLDIDPFVLVLTSSAPYTDYYNQYPSCDHALADCNTDGSVNSLDIDPFVDLLTGG